MRKFLSSFGFRVTILVLWFLIGVLTVTYDFCNPVTYVPLWIAFLWEYGVNTLNKAEEMKQKKSSYT